MLRLATAAANNSNRRNNARANNRAWTLRVCD
jgi:hypothetical protein